MDDLRNVPNRSVIVSRTVRVNASDGPVGAWPSKLFIDVSRRETYRWIGIGVTRESVLAPKSDKHFVEVPIPYPGIQLLCSGEKCRTLIIQHLMPKLKDSDEYTSFTVADWDNCIPKNIEWAIKESCNHIPITCTCRCDVSIELTIQFLYCEATSLHQGCLNARSACSICLEELVP